MINEKQYTTIRNIASRIMMHPMMNDVTLEQIVYYVTDFINIFGFNEMYEEKEDILTIKDYRTLLPCDLIRIIQIKDCNTGICLRSMDATFNDNTELTFKTQGRVLYTSFEEGLIDIKYYAIPIDENGYPKIIDDPIYLKALELYIKQEIFGILFDQGKINQTVLQHTEQEYSWAAGRLQNALTIPSMSEMESIKNMWTSLIPSKNDFAQGFRNMSNYEHRKF